MPSVHPGTFRAEASALGLDFVVSALTNCPESLAPLLHAKLRLAARRLARATKMDEHAALDVMARVVSARSWPVLDLQLGAVPLATESAESAESTAWLNPFTPAVVLLCEPVTGVALDSAVVRSFEALARAIGQQSMQRWRDVLDGVCARFCGCDAWEDAVHGARPGPSWRPTNF
jgi:hypothetical protein